MAIRAVSGIVKALGGPRVGRVTIGFNPHRVISGDAEVIEMRELGPQRDFRALPVVSVALRQIGDVHLAFNESGRFVIDDTLTTEELVISWEAEQSAIVDEVSYIAVGDVGSRFRSLFGG